ncbi:hypothetical protein JCGZ_14051 [Jatropha curcas]|uniref:Pectinesterase n=2 Tax=Jatropha curcas TaxID=180498 RepID=A0A067K7P8_JATCU|nr:hypothetical protein JCGZ_14051 [Jatropha curcas]
MKNLPSFLFAVLLFALLHCWSGSEASDCQYSKNHVAYTITVDKSGKGNFSSVQSAINHIPERNTRWIRIRISSGKYNEKVTVPARKPCIVFEGAGRHLTSIEWGDHQDTSTSATFTSNPDNIVAKGITFKNTYNWGKAKITNWRQAVSARLKGDKYAFYDCAFLGLQDTLWDENGLHYFRGCYIEGAVDFIFGKAQSIYEECVISVNIGKYEKESKGSITAQKKEWPEYKSGFVFKNCVINGTGKAILGRAWGPYSTVIIYNSFLSEVVDPKGWDAWEYYGHEANLTYVEANNNGEGANTSMRVSWLKKLSSNELNKFLDISFINGNEWLDKIPTSFN